MELWLTRFPGSTLKSEMKSLDWNTSSSLRWLDLSASVNAHTSM